MWDLHGTSQTFTQGHYLVGSFVEVGGICWHQSFSLCVWVLKVWVVVMILLLCNTGCLWVWINLTSFLQLNAWSWAPRAAWKTSNGLFMSFEVTMPANIKLLILLTPCPNAQLDKALNNILRNTDISINYGGGAPCMLMEQKPSENSFIPSFQSLLLWQPNKLLHN